MQREEDVEVYSFAMRIRVHRMKSETMHPEYERDLIFIMFFFFLRIRRPPRSTLFPYPPPSRSAQAAAVMPLNRLSCRESRGRLGERREHMPAIRVDGVPPAVLATWSLAAECAHSAASDQEIGRAHV